MTFLFILIAVVVSAEPGPGFAVINSEGLLIPLRGECVGNGTNFAVKKLTLNNSTDVKKCAVIYENPRCSGYSVKIEAGTELAGHVVNNLNRIYGWSIKGVNCNDIESGETVTEVPAGARPGFVLKGEQFVVPITVDTCHNFTGKLDLGISRSVTECLWLYTRPGCTGSSITLDYEYVHYAIGRRNIYPWKPESVTAIDCNLPIRAIQLRPIPSDASIITFDSAGRSVTNPRSPKARELSSNATSNRADSLKWAARVLGLISV